MVEVKKQHVKIVSIIIALVFVGSVVALALTQSGSGIASAAASSNVGVIDYNAVMSQHPKMEEARKTFQEEQAAAQKDFEEKSAGMSDEEKSNYGRQTFTRLQQRESELIEPIRQSVEEQIKTVANAKGLNVVIEKSAVLYGGTDITQDVLKKLNK